MDSAADWSTEPEVRARRSWWPAILLLVLLAFAGGIAIATYAVRQSPRVAALLKLQPEAAIVPVRALAVPAPTAAPDPAAAMRLAALEQRIGEIDERTAAASGNAERAEGLLVAFAARRALDRGIALGYIEGLMRDRFGGTDPQAVAAVIAASREPVTLDELQNGLDALRPKLSVSVPTENWWTNVKQELASLIVVRPADTPSNIPADRVQRATRQMEAGQVDRAMAEIARLPGRAAATDWMAKARRYVQARNALDRIETTALLRPHTTPPPAVLPAAAE